jgi:hypothetical protein
LVEIHGIGQLDVPAGGSLHLGVLRLVRDERAGQSFADLVRACAASGASHADLLALLASAGITSSAPEYEGARFEVAERRLYQVDEDFPRLIPSSLVAGTLPDALVDLSYQLDLTTASPAPLSELALEEALRRLAGAI